MSLKMKGKNTKGFNVLIKALKDSHTDTKNIADMIDNWTEDKEIDVKEIEKLEEWLRIAKCDKSRKVARCIAKCIYNNFLECN